MKAQLKISSAAFAYDNQNIFSDINLELFKGETLCILGPNGCGKTTLLHCINRTLVLKKGDILIEGKQLKQMNPAQIARKIGIVFQEQEVPFPFSVLEIVRMGRTPHLGFLGTPSRKDTDIATEALELVGIPHLKDKPFTQTSGGERQLALIARALTQGPSIIMLDEPTSHLDFKNQAMVLSMIKKLASLGISIIITTHAPDHAFRVSTKVALMNAGRILDIGKPLDIVTRDNLKATYGMEINVIPLKIPGDEDDINICLPVSDQSRNNGAETLRFRNFLAKMILKSD
jgi:iron complex transport system ATP-binding protein